jgi:hypothetical protein
LIEIKANVTDAPMVTFGYHDMEIEHFCSVPPSEQPILCSITDKRFGQVSVTESSGTPA